MCNFLEALCITLDLIPFLHEILLFRERDERLAVLNAQHEAHIKELQKKIQQKVCWQIMASEERERAKSTITSHKNLLIIITVVPTILHEVNVLLSDKRNLPMSNLF